MGQGGEVVPLVEMDAAMVGAVRFRNMGCLAVRQGTAASKPP
jgi:hypothetical protein